MAKVSSLYHPRDLDDFLSNLKTLSISDTSKNDCEAILSASRRLNIPTQRVVQIILRDKIQLFAADPRTAKFRDFRVSIEDLREATIRDKAGAIHQKRAAEILGVNEYAVSILVRKGLLESQLVREFHSGRERRYVCSASMEVFQKNYVTVSQLAKQSGRPPGSEALYHMDRGVAPVDRRSGCHTIFLKRDVT